jgi:hypothetical protein
MWLTLDDGWTSREDSTGEFALSPRSSPDDQDVLFWEDVYPVEDGERVQGVPRSTAGLLDWMMANPNLEVAAPTRGAIGDIPATVVDVRVADDAVNDDPNCPVQACANFLGFPQWDGVWGLAAPARFYLSDVTYGGRQHLFVAAIYAENPADLKTLGAAAERLIASVRVAADPA